MNYNNIGYIRVSDLSAAEEVSDNDLFLVCQKNSGTRKTEAFKVDFKKFYDVMSEYPNILINQNSSDIFSISSNAVFLSTDQEIKSNKHFNLSNEFLSSVTFLSDVNFLSSVPICRESENLSGSDIVNIDYLNDHKNIFKLPIWKSSSVSSLVSYTKQKNTDITFLSAGIFKPSEYNYPPGPKYYEYKYTLENKVSAFTDGYYMFSLEKDLSDVYYNSTIHNIANSLEIIDGNWGFLAEINNKYFLINFNSLLGSSYNDSGYSSNGYLATEYSPSFFCDASINKRPIKFWPYSNGDNFNAKYIDYNNKLLYFYLNKFNIFNNDLKETIPFSFNYPLSTMMFSNTSPTSTNFVTGVNKPVYSMFLHKGDVFGFEYKPHIRIALNDSVSPEWKTLSNASVYKKLVDTSTWNKYYNDIVKDRILSSHTSIYSNYLNSTSQNYKDVKNYYDTQINHCGIRMNYYVYPIA